VEGQKNYKTTSCFQVNCSNILPPDGEDVGDVKSFFTNGNGGNGVKMLADYDYGVKKYKGNVYGIEDLDAVRRLH
jgi:hypothetical protein